MKIKLLVLLFLTIFGLNQILASSELEESPKELKFYELRKSLVTPLFVKFALPDDFCAVYVEEFPDSFYLGPKEVLIDYFNDPGSLSQPILYVTYNLFTREEVLSDQIPEAPLLFLGQHAQLIEDEILSHSNSLWGPYPVKEIGKKKLHYYRYEAFVNFSKPEINDYDLFCDTAHFSLITPKKKPSEEDLKFWRTFLEKTEVLSLQQVAFLIGQKLHNGFTIVQANSSTTTPEFKVTAEKRKKDGELQIGIITPNKDIQIDFFEGFEWEPNEENTVKILNVVCLIQKEEDNLWIDKCKKCVFVEVTDVDEFSLADNNSETVKLY